MLFVVQLHMLHELVWMQVHGAQLHQHNSKDDKASANHVVPEYLLAEVEGSECDSSDHHGREGE